MDLAVVPNLGKTLAPLQASKLLKIKLNNRTLWESRVSPVTTIKDNSNPNHCYLFLQKKCHITFTQHVYDLTFISRGGGDGGGVTGEEAASPETVCQHCEGEATGCFLTRGHVVSTTVRETTMEIFFKETLGQFPEVYVVINKQISLISLTIATCSLPSKHTALFGSERN